MGYYPFTGNAYDESGHNNNGTVNGATPIEDRHGNASSAYQFDGIDDYINIPHSSSLAVSSYVTVSAWVRMPQADSGVIMVKGNYGHLWDYGMSTYWSYPSYPESGGEFVFNEYRGRNDNYGGWHHFAVTVDEVNGNILAMYMDGIAMSGLLSRINDINVTSGNYIRPTTGSLKIGGIPEAPYSFKGMIDDVRIYNRTLSPAEIGIIYQEEKPVQQSGTDGLIAHYPFNGNANDASGNDHHGIASGATLTTDRFGNSDCAYTFDGVNDYIDLGNLGGYKSHTFTGWFLIKGNQNGYGALVSKLYNDLHFAKNSEIRIDQNRGDGYHISSQLGTGTTWEGTHIDVRVDSAVWHHFAYMYDENEKSIKVYLDQELVDSIAVSGYSDVPTTPTYIGARPYWNGPTVFFFHGKIDDIRIYNRSLSTDEIDALFKEGKCFETIYDTIVTEVFDTTFVTVHDTIFTEVRDTSYIAVTDTLVIDAVLTGIDPPENINTLKVYPNPARDHVYIETGDHTKMAGYRLKIINQLGTVVFETSVEEPLYEIDLSNWTGYGMYFIQVIDPGGSIFDIRKIILE